MKRKYTLDQSHMPLENLDSDLRLINPICLDILYRRGFRTSDEIRSILFPDLANSLRPFACKDSVSAVTNLATAIQDGLHIVVYRDYDVDGITAGALAVETLAALGAKVHHYANEREVDGFGICINGIDAILNLWPETKVILTVDNGISGNDAVEYARSRGLTVIVTDHHEPGDFLPAAAAVVDLKRKDESYPFHDLCGCGVIFRIMLDLYRYLKKDPTPVLQTLDLVALATVADVVPLLGENRALVQEGLKLIGTGQRPFFRVILRLLNVSEVNAHHTLAFLIAPILNSLSRMNEDTALAVEALLSRDESWVELQALTFRDINQRRKDETQRQLDIARKMLAGNPDTPAILLYSDEFSEGIVGIIAGQLKEQFMKPVIVLAKDSCGNMKGSGRSTSDVSMKDTLDQCSSLLSNYGGHDRAAGLSLMPDNLDAFVSLFNQLVQEQVASGETHDEVALAALLDESDVTEQLVSDLRILEPYGEGFPEPVFGLVAKPESTRYMGQEQQHVKLFCPKSGLSIIAWNMADKIRGKPNLPTKFIGKPSVNIWKDTVSVQFIHNP